MKDMVKVNGLDILPSSVLALPITCLRLATVAAYQHQSSFEKQNYNEPQQ